VFIHIYGEQVPLPPDTIFRRISFLKKSKEEMKSYFELAPYPLSILEETGMGKTKKSVLYDFFSPTTEQVNYKILFIWLMVDIFYTGLHGSQKTSFIPYSKRMWVT
jgi:hypothetical protein